jgi:phage protein D
MLVNPAYKIVIGGKLIDTTDEPRASTVVALNVALDMETPADSFTLVLGNVGSFRPARGDETKIELGYFGDEDDEELTQVVSGTIETIEPNLTTTRINGYSGASAVLRARVEKTYENMEAGEIVRDLASQAGVDVATAEAGVTFPAYVVDGRRNVYAHMADLAALCGFDLYINPDGELVFEKFVNGKKIHVFEYKKHILALDVQRLPPRAGLVEAWGESPAKGEADDTWAWLTKDFAGAKGSAGSGALMLLERASLRTVEAARSAAEATLTNIKRRTLRGSLKSVGRPAIKLGDAIRLSEMPDESLNDSFQVRSVTHRITKLGGFTTTVGFRAIEVS